MRELALGLERLAHAHERHVEAALQHAQRRRARVVRQLELRRARGHDVGRGVAPAQAALRDLVERRGALCGELAEDAPRLLAQVARDLGALPAIQRATATVETAPTRAKLSLTIASCVCPDSAERRTMSRTTSSLRCLSCAPSCWSWGLLADIVLPSSACASGDLKSRFTVSTARRGRTPIRGMYPGPQQRSPSATSIATTSPIAISWSPAGSARAGRVQAGRCPLAHSTHSGARTTSKPAWLSLRLSVFTVKPVRCALYSQPSAMSLRSP